MSALSQSVDQCAVEAPQTVHHPVQEGHQGDIEALMQQLLIEPLQVTKLCVGFSCSIRKKLVDCLSFGDEGFLQKSYLFIMRSGVVSDFNLFKKTIQAHALHDAISAANRLLESAGQRGIEHARYLHDIVADEDLTASNVNFVDNMEEAVERLVMRIEQACELAADLREKLAILAAETRTESDPASGAEIH